MPLSEHEQRILEEIEKGLYKEDPSLAREIKRKAPTAQDRRRVRAGIVVFVLGFVILIAFFATGLILLGVAAFGAMVYGIVLVAGSLLASFAPRRPPGPRIPDRISDATKRMEDKLRRRYKRH